MKKEVVEEPILEEKKVEKTKTEIQVYVGPTINGVASHNLFLNNGITEELRKAIQKEPAFANLIVPVSKLALVSDEIANKRGATYVFYQKVSDYKA